MRASKARTEIRQDQIARAAMKLLAGRGWQRVSLAAIARKVGVVPSAVYRHFKGKNEVLDAVLDLVSQSFQNNVQAARRATSDPVARLRDVLVRHVNLITSGVPVPRIILSEDIFTGSPRHRKRVHAIYQAYLAQIADIIQDAQRRGLIRRELVAETLALMWLGLVQSPAILWLLSEGTFDLRQHCDRAWELFTVTVSSRRSRKAK